MRLSSFNILILLAIAFLIGCDGGEPSGTVSGEVTYQGTAVGDCIIQFSASSIKSRASGYIEDGKFTLKTLDGSSRIPVGKYRVHFTLDESQLPSLTAEEEMRGKKPPPIEYPEWLTLQLRSPRETPLEREIKVGANEFTITLDPDQ